MWIVKWKLDSSCIFLPVEIDRVWLNCHHKTGSLYYQRWWDLWEVYKWGAHASLKGSFTVRRVWSESGRRGVCDVSDDSKETCFACSCCFVSFSFFVQYKLRRYFGGLLLRYIVFIPSFYVIKESFIGSGVRLMRASADADLFGPFGLSLCLTLCLLCWRMSECLAVC